ncbi:ATP-binding protein [Phytohalomonas tamaricis]|uniref:ATP-binding protein n=1 Tax=Phytohalomonas tamaricis TaxID=2081032 RepID=UPI000D0B927A|nr:ATP-binding protein [Phytohalomonas tamaricis]
MRSTGGAFLRVYLALFAALLVIFALGLLGVSLLNDTRAQQYRERLTSAPMALLSALVEAQPEDKRDAWLREYEDDLGMGLALSDTEMPALGYWDRRRLDDGGTVVKSAGSEAGWRLYKRLPQSDSMLVVHFSELSEKQPQRLMALLRLWLEQVPSEEREARFRQLRDVTSLNMGLGSGTPAGLSASQREQLNAGNVVMSLAPERLDLSLYAQLSDGRWISAGPIQPFEPIPRMPIAIVMIVMLVMLGVIFYLIVRRLESRLQRLERAASRIAAGHLDTRVSVDSGDYLGQLGHAFNAMAAQVQAVLSAQQDLMRAVSHEFRTPVARIRFALQMVEDMSESPVIKRQLKEVDSDIESLDKLIDEILTYARLESATDAALPLEVVSLECREMAEEVITTVTPLHPNLTLSIQGVDELWVEADPRSLKRALQNLVVNACWHAHEKVIIELSSDDKQASLSVEDDGPGVSPRDREKIFKPFARLDTSRTRRSGGYGLGLAIVAKIMRWHYGQVIVDTSPHLGGASFRLVLPHVMPDYTDSERPVPTDATRDGN